MPTPVTPDTLQKMDACWRAANYLSVGQIYLRDNPLLDRHQLALDAIRRIPRLADQVAAETARHETTLQRHEHCIGEHGEDMPEILDWRWTA